MNDLEPKMTSLYDFIQYLYPERKIQGKNIDQLKTLLDYVIRILTFHNRKDYGNVTVITPTGTELLRVPVSYFEKEACAFLKGGLETMRDSMANASIDTKSLGKTDIQIILQDQRTNKKDSFFSDSNLLNASGDNTNFVYEVTGPMDDERMDVFNTIYKTSTSNGSVRHHVATSARMEYLHKLGCDLVFAGTAREIARENLIKSGGMEMPLIVGGMLKKFYFENLGSTTSVEDCVKYLAENDIAGYRFRDLMSTYRSKVAQLLLNTFTGMRLGAPWNGRQEVNGGYIVVKSDGEVVAFHSTIADEFKDFLVSKMMMESPSHTRHHDMVIYKEGDKYYLKLALQLRFALSR